MSKNEPFQLGQKLSYQLMNLFINLFAGDTPPDNYPIWINTSVTPPSLNWWKQEGESGEWVEVGEITSPLSLLVTGDNAEFTGIRTDGATTVVGAGETMSYVGSQNNYPLRLIVNNSWVLRILTDGTVEISNDRFFVTANGSVGIGTTTPSAKLHVLGDILASGNISGSGIDSDKLDGQHGSYYQNASNLNAGDVSRARLNLLSNFSSPFEMAETVIASDQAVIYYGFSFTGSTPIPIINAHHSSYICTYSTYNHQAHRFSIRIHDQNQNPVTNATVSYRAIGSRS